MVTCKTSGRAIGTAPMRIDKAVSKVPLKLVSQPPRRSPWTTTMRMASRTAMEITMFTTIITFCSNTETLAVARSAMMSACPAPISVLIPVARMMQYASPCFTVVPDRMSLPYSSLGYLRGSGSPVRAAVSMLSTSPSIHSTSAGVREPPRRWITSPGTSCVTPMVFGVPSLTQVMVDSIWLVNSRRAFFAFISSRKPRSAFTTTMARITKKSGQSPASAEIMQLISSIMGMAPTNWLRMIFQIGVSTAGISLGPNSSIFWAACAEVRPALSFETAIEANLSFATSPALRSAIFTPCPRRGVLCARESKA
mmetsp:Transcript_5930/g.10628  ORF Transcript_5930/g.10628 Transcript_5930/m.10628 type:complete len:310 (+) Transcript_5930:2284-3213(+)